jgi:hypothetical protein
MYLIGGILFIVLGIFGLIKPEIIAKLNNTWKFKDPTPTNDYLFAVKVSSGFIILLGIVFIFST